MNLQTSFDLRRTEAETAARIAREVAPRDAKHVPEVA
jgi:hypothetical protein